MVLMASWYAIPSSSGLNAASCQFGPLPVGFVRSILTASRCRHGARRRHLLRHSASSHAGDFSGICPYAFIALNSDAAPITLIRIIPPRRAQPRTLAAAVLHDEARIVVAPRSPKAAGSGARRAHAWPGGQRQTHPRLRRRGAVCQRVVLAAQQLRLAVPRASSVVSRLDARRCDAAICRESGEKRKCATCACNDVNAAVQRHLDRPDPTANCTRGV
jgi:hypothetical protein